MKKYFSEAFNIIAFIIGLCSALSWTLSAQTDIKVLVDFFNLNAAKLAVISSMLVAIASLLK